MKVLIMNSQGGVVFEGSILVKNMEIDPETETPIGEITLDGVTIRVWKFEKIWQGWLQ